MRASGCPVLTGGSSDSGSSPVTYLRMLPFGGTVFPKNASLFAVAVHATEPSVSTPRRRPTDKSPVCFSALPRSPKLSTGGSTPCPAISNPLLGLGGPNDKSSKLGRRGGNRQAVSDRTGG